MELIQTAAVCANWVRHRDKKANDAACKAADSVNAAGMARKPD